MEYHRTLNLDLTIISAKGLKNVNPTSKLEAYAIVHIDGGDPTEKQQTDTDISSDVEPTWHFPMTFNIDKVSMQKNRLTLIVELRAERGDLEIGQVEVPIKEMIGDGNIKSAQLVRYQIKESNGSANGELELSYKYSEKMPWNYVVREMDEAFPAAEPRPAVAYHPLVSYSLGGTSSDFPGRVPGRVQLSDFPGPILSSCPQEPPIAEPTPPPPPPGYGFKYGNLPQQPGYMRPWDMI